MVPDKRNDRENRPGRRAPAETANSSALTRVAGPRHTAQGGSDPESDLVRDSPGRDDPSLPPDCAGSSMSFIGRSFCLIGTIGEVTLAEDD